MRKNNYLKNISNSFIYNFIYFLIRKLGQRIKKTNLIPKFYAAYLLFILHLEKTVVGKKTYNISVYQIYQKFYKIAVFYIKNS